MERWNPLSGASPSSSSSSKSDVFLRAIVSVLAGTAVTVISAFVMKYIVVDSLADKMLGAPGIGDGSENPYASNQQGKTNTGGGGAISAHERLQTLRLSQHERSLLPDLVFPEDVDAGVEDVGGLDSQLRELREQVIYPLSHPHLYAHSAVAQRPTGMLLYGPPGTGKTLLAKAIAKSTKAAFLNVNVAQLQSKWYGETPKLVTALFSLARKLAPCILFVDEIDGLLGKRRDGAGGHHHQARRGGRHLAQQHQQRLQHRVGEAVAHRRIFDDALDVVDEDDADRGLVAVRDPLEQRAAAPALAVANHCRGRDHADEGEVTLSS